MFICEKTGIGLFPTPDRANEKDTSAGIRRLRTFINKRIEHVESFSFHTSLHCLLTCRPQCLTFLILQRNGELMMSAFAGN